jgi:hypothetical protein
MELYISSLETESSMVGQCCRGVLWIDVTLSFVQVRSLTVAAVNLVVLVMQCCLHISHLANMRPSAT